MAIAKGAVEAYLARELDTFLWMKKLAAGDIRSELSSFRVKPRFKTEPWLHQLVCFYIGMCRPEFLFLLDMGLGKSKIILDLMTQAQREKKLNHALVTVPRLINIGSWETAIETHSDLEPVLATGSIEEKWEKLIDPRGDITVIDYPGLQLALSTKKASKKGNKLVRDDKKVAQLQKIYNFIAPDEIHKCKNPDSLRFGLMRQLMKTADYKYGLTGTPFGRDPTDVWSQFYLVDDGETFGETLGMFRAAFFKEVADYWSGRTFVFDTKMNRKFHRMLQHRSIRYEEEECQDLPKRVHIPVKLCLPDDQKQQYLKMIESIISAGGDFKKVEAPFIRMRQLTSGFLEWKDELGPHSVTFEHNPKLDALEKIIEECGGEKVAVFHDYTRTGQLICERLKQMAVKHSWLYGGSKDPIHMVEDFKRDPTKQVFVMNSESGSTGVDGLQEVCRYLVFFESPVSPITRKQAIKRVHRPGSSRKVFIYDLILQNSVDVRILDFIEEGRNLFEALVNGQIDPMLLRFK